MRRPVTEECVAEGCERTRRSRRPGYCRMHQYRLEKYGSLDDPKTLRACRACGDEFLPPRADSTYCSKLGCADEAKRQDNRDRERRIFSETGEWRGRVQERKNPLIVENNRERRRRADAELPSRKRYAASTEARDARRRLRKIQNTPQLVEPFTRDEIGDRDSWICQLCGEPIDRSLQWPDPLSKSLDHITPLAKGGSHVRENCQITHLGCNLSKGSRE